ADDVVERARRRAPTERRLQTRRRGRVAQPRARVEVGGAGDARELLDRVVGLVGEAARGDEEAHALGAGRRERERDRGRGVVPRDAREGAFSPTTTKWIWKAAERVQLGVRQLAQ